jgi:hypothetical protein
MDGVVAAKCTWGAETELGILLGVIKFVEACIVKHVSTDDEEA